MNITLEIWRQPSAEAAGRFVTYRVSDATPEMSLLELLDRLNATLLEEGDEPVAFESDCREGVCGSCGIDVDGRPHGPVPNTPACRQHLRSFANGQTVRLEPFRSAAFPVVRDLVVDRSALDRVIGAGGYISVDAGTAPDADSVLIPHRVAEAALDFAACIGCGACVAACPNGSAALFTGAKLVHLSLLPHGRQERGRRARSMSAQAEAEFGPCSLFGECARVCPAGIPLSAVAAVNRERLRAWTAGRVQDLR
jgi:succinate dehydrogenase / fumarate reductase iron-sulfur subunit